MVKVVAARCVVVFCLWLSVTTSARAIDCDTIPVPSPIDVDSIATFQFNGGASCWGWIAPDGEEYAIMGTGDGIDVVRVSTLQHVAHAPMQLCGWRELKTYRHYCYVVSECNSAPNAGMMIVDLQYLPDSVHVVGAYTGTGARSHCISIDTARGYAYLVKQSYIGFRIVSLANPEAPVDIGSGVNTGDLHDMTAFNDTVYAAEGSDGAFSIWDCTNKLAPVQLAHVTIPGNSNYVHNLWPTPDRRFLASTEELPDFRTMKIWNIEDLNNIYMVAEYIGPGGIPHNAHIEGDYLYLAHYSSGVSFLDINYPECPREVAIFDTYLANNNPIFEGCWGVYPHTAGRQTVYASNIDGRFFILRTSIVEAEFTASPTIGEAPLQVNFTDGSPIASGWNWQFGDGDSAAIQNPMHVYDAGLYTVQLGVTTPYGTGIELKPNYITALAETLKVVDTNVAAGTGYVWDIMYENNVPLTEIKIPIQLSNVPSVATMDSVSVVGCRTDYFELKQFLIQSYGTGRAVLLLRANNGGLSQALAPGNGPIARVHFTINPGATVGQQVVLTMPPIGIAQHSLTAYTHTTSYVPDLVGATATVFASCNCSCHGDPICDGVHNVLDVVETVDAAFRNEAPVIDPSCPHQGRADLNCSGEAEVLDVVALINVVFRNGDAQSLICDPCTL